MNSALSESQHLAGMVVDSKACMRECCCGYIIVLQTASESGKTEAQGPEVQ